METTNFLLQAAAAQQPGGSWMTIVMMVAIFGVVYFLMIRPQQKRQKELNNFRKELKKGDKIITAGGIYGTIKGIEENTVAIEVDNNVNIRVDKTMIMRDPSDFQQK